MLQCPSCGALSISLKAREKLLWRIQCPACKTYLRLKWGRSLLLGYLAAMALLVIGVLIKIPALKHFPGALLMTSSFCLALAFQAINRRLPLEPKL